MNQEEYNYLKKLVWKEVSFPFYVRSYKRKLKIKKYEHIFKSTKSKRIKKKQIKKILHLLWEHAIDYELSKMEVLRMDIHHVD